MKNLSKNQIALSIGSLVAVVGIGGAVYFFRKKKNAKTEATPKHDLQSENGTTAQNAS